jgi:hypothetical protein
VGNNSGYTLLRKALPKFLQLVVSDSGLYTEHNGHLVVSFSGVLSAPRYEVRRFVTYDTLTGFLLGVSPLVEYWYDVRSGDEPHGFDWPHGIPAAFITIIAQINSHRAGSRVSLEDWEILEKRILSWVPPLTVPDGSSHIESASTARLSIQEGWRHVLLIYLYMVYPQYSSSSLFMCLNIADRVFAEFPHTIHAYRHRCSGYLN